jgi:hypothetical protein
LADDDDESLEEVDDDESDDELDDDSEDESEDDVLAEGAFVDDLSLRA